MIVISKTGYILQIKVGKDDKAFGVLGAHEHSGLE